MTRDVSPAREILRLSWPAAVQQLLQSAMFFVDTALIGHLSPEAGGSQPLAAIQICGPLVWSAATIASFFAVGTTAVVARAAGERDPTKARRATSVSMRLALWAGLAAGVLGLLGAPAFTDLYGGPDLHPRTRSDATLFLRIFAAGFPMHLLVLVQMSALRGAGDTRSPMTAGLLANVLNAAGNVLLLPRLGVPGAAVATFVATLAEGAWLSRRLARGPRKAVGPFVLTLPYREFGRWDLPAARTILGVSLPSLGEAIVSHSAFLAYQHAINRISEAAMAAQRIAITWESLAFMPAFGLYIGTAAFCGQRLGEKRPDLAERGVWRAAAWGAGFSLVLSAAFLAAPEGLSRLVAGEEPATVALAAGALRIAAAEVPFLVAATALYGGLRGAGETKGPLLVSFVGGWLVRVPLSYALGLSLGWGLAGVWVATLADWACRTALYARLFSRGAWKRVVL